MSKKLAGTLFIKNGVSLDYCFEAALNSVMAFCDHTFICYVESEGDGTLKILEKYIGDNCTALMCGLEMWHAVSGREKLSYFTNIAIEYAQSQGYEYQFNIQGDEVVTPESIPYIKQALDLGEEGFYVTRHNFWKDEFHILNVPQSRKPVSTQIARLTKTNYRSVGDAESCDCPCSLDFINLIEVNHYGFIRSNKKHIAKIKEMQKNIFLFDSYDSRADLKPEFDWRDWGFTEQDLIKTNKPVPHYVEDWLKNRNK